MASGEKSFAVALKYNAITNIHNSIDWTFGGQTVVTDSSPSVSVLGLGATYNLPLSDSFSFTPGLFLMGVSQKLFNFDNGLLTQVTGYFNYRFGQHGLYFGPNIQQIIVVKPLTYSPKLGAGFGYQYFLNSDFTIQAGFELIALSSENKDGFISQQRSELRTYNLTLSYAIF